MGEHSSWRREKIAAAASSGEFARTRAGLFRYARGAKSAVSVAWIPLQEVLSPTIAFVDPSERRYKVSMSPIICAEDEIDLMNCVFLRGGWTVAPPKSDCRANAANVSSETWSSVLCR